MIFVFIRVDTLAKKASIHFLVTFFFAAHIQHIRKFAGVDHVGIEAGFDGINL